MAAASTSLTWGAPQNRQGRGRGAGGRPGRRVPLPLLPRLSCGGFHSSGRKPWLSQIALNALGNGRATAPPPPAPRDGPFGPGCLGAARKRPPSPRAFWPPDSPLMREWQEYSGPRPNSARKASTLLRLRGRVSAPSAATAPFFWSNSLTCGLGGGGGFLRVLYWSRGGVTAVVLFSEGGIGKGVSKGPSAEAAGPGPPARASPCGRDDPGPDRGRLSPLQRARAPARPPAPAPSPCAPFSQSPFQPALPAGSSG